MHSTNDAFPESQASSRRFESDTQKLVHLHLRDKHHVITDAEFKSLRVGMRIPDERIENRAPAAPFENDSENLYPGESILP